MNACTLRYAHTHLNGYATVAVILETTRTGKKNTREPEIEKERAKGKRIKLPQQCSKQVPNMMSVGFANAISLFTKSDRHRQVQTQTYHLYFEDIYIYTQHTHTHTRAQMEDSF